MIKEEEHKVKGMNRDTTVSRFSSEFVFDAQNIRMTARENNTLLSITNEKGNKEIVDSDGNAITLTGTVLGYNVLNSYLTVFTTYVAMTMNESNVDRIYRLEKKDDYFECITLYEGSLDFDINYPIETLGVFENEDIQKVYWIDGKNQSRFINIVATDSVKEGWNDGSFDFVQDLNLTDVISVTRNDTASGMFAAGVIQYAFTYYNLYGQESNIFYITRLQYISYTDRGASAEDKVSCSFTITIENPDPRFDYVRVYSIHRTSIDATPTVTNVIDLAINGTETLTYIDNGTTGSTIDPTELLYIGGESVVAQTMTQKDNTLFLGNIKLNSKIVSEELREKVSELSSKIIFSKYSDPFTAQTISGYYSYKNQLSGGARIRSFHSNEYYRFGIQFQAKNGKWSEAVYITDLKNSYYPSSLYLSSGVRELVEVVWARVQLDEELIKLAVEEGFVRARGLVVYPDVVDREVIAQGIICPTVYNLSDRYSNSPYAQASWFSRPFLGVDVDLSKNDDYTGYSWEYIPYSTLVENDEGDDGTASDNTNENMHYYNGRSLVNYGAWAEFRHNYPIPSNWMRNAEIQCLANVPSTPYIEGDDYESISTGTSGDTYDSWIAEHQEYFFIDQSVVTMHSPEFEFDDSFANLDTSSLKLRLVGRALFTANASDIDIQTSTSAYYSKSVGFYKENIGVKNISSFGSRSLISGAFYFDRHVDVPSDWSHTEQISWYVYPWHRNGSLNNEGTPSSSSTTRSAMLSQKIISNLKFAGFTEYLSTPWKTEADSDDTSADAPYRTGISGAVLFDSDEQTLVRLPAPANSGLEDLNYYGNIDKIITPTRAGDAYTAQGQSSVKPEDGYPIIIGAWPYGGNIEDPHRMFIGGPHLLYKFESNSWDGDHGTYMGTDPVSMKYKSTPHVVMAFNYTEDGRQVVLPTIQASYRHNSNLLKFSINSAVDGLTNGVMPWDTSCTGVYQTVVDDDNISTSQFKGTGFLWIGELYNDNVENRFGGTSQEAIEQNSWIPAGDVVDLVEYDSEGNSTARSYANLYYTEGDTFFQRYDCLKTYPYTSEDQNQIVEIISFYCETRVNIDGRYDRNRGQTSNLAITPTNFNLINDIYTQKNNFFTYRTLNYNRFTLDYFPNTITWTTEKYAGDTTDAWTNVTVASTLDLDGDKGEIVSLNTFNNNIYCFQQRGLSNILFNSRVQVSTSDGEPIEITNGLKVDGKRYINNSIGCNNKWSIVETPSGLYFIDNITDNIYQFDGDKLNSLSDKFGFKQWIGANNSLDKWTPTGFKNFISFYDKSNNDIYFVNDNTALVYSEVLNQFTSFMSYGGVPAMFNIDNNFYAIKREGISNYKVWEQFAGDYNMFFGEFQPYSITFISNTEAAKDKIFNNIEFRSDCWTKDEDGNDVLLSKNTFDTLEVWDEYQKGVSTLTDLTAKPTPLRRKFRVWRANIPRANTDWNGVKANYRDRIRNTWAYIKLARNEENTDRMEFHDMIVRYFV